MGPNASAPTLSAPLWRQLQLAAGILMAVRAGRSGTAALETTDPALRPGVQALSYQTLRRLGRAEALRRQLARRTPPPAADALLCTALALVCHPDDAPHESFTLVDQAVEAAKREPATRAQAPFVNACLRRFLREREALLGVIEREPVAHWNHPRWWIERMRRDHPGAWQGILAAANLRPPMTLRVNTRKTTPAQYQQALAAINIGSIRVADCGLELERALPVGQLPGFAEGAVSVQDAAAQLAAPLLLAGLSHDAPLRVLDACAAPGGKTAHLLELGGDDVHVIAVELDEARSRRIGESLDRLGLAGRATVCVADAARPESWWDGQPFDAVLLDAPCTASGIVRRHPDIRWLRREGDLGQLAAQQERLLAALWPLVRPGGRLLYCTCSVFLLEGRQQVDAFLARNTDARLSPSPGHLLPPGGRVTAPVPDNPLGDHDGFFYARLEKAAH